MPGAALHKNVAAKKNRQSENFPNSNILSPKRIAMFYTHYVDAYISSLEYRFSIKITEVYI